MRILSIGIVRASDDSCNSAADQWHRIKEIFGAQRAEEALRNYIPATRYDPDYREALNGIAVWHQEQGRLLPAPLAAWASQCYRGELPTPPKHRGDHGRPVYAQANRNLAMAEVFHLLGYLGLHEKLTRYHAIGAEFGCSEDTVRKALKTHHARWTGELPRPWECWPPPRRKSPSPR